MDEGTRLRKEGLALNDSSPHPLPRSGRQTQRHEHNHPGTELDHNKNGAVLFLSPAKRCGEDHLRMSDSSSPKSIGS